MRIAARVYATLMTVKAGYNLASQKSITHIRRKLDVR